ncbi:hypothetical protein V6Z11_A04G032600 [Gossypium hirsutum]
MRKEVALVQKKIDAVNKELKPLGDTCQKKCTNHQYRLLDLFRQSHISTLKGYTRYMCQWVIFSKLPSKKKQIKTKTHFEFLGS